MYANMILTYLVNRFRFLKSNVCNSDYYKAVRCDKNNVVVIRLSHKRQNPQYVVYNYKVDNRYIPYEKSEEIKYHFYNMVFEDDEIKWANNKIKLDNICYANKVHDIIYNANDFDLNKLDKIGKGIDFLLINNQYYKFFLEDSIKYNDNEKNVSTSN